MILALDFDGVLCDSAAETAASAWRAGQKIWPHWESPEPPQTWVDGFRAVRPYLETGYQAIPMLRMVEQKMPVTAFESELEEHIEAILSETGLTREEMIAMFGQARDQWISHDEASWLARHTFFDGTLERVQQRISHGDDLHVITTKQERFVHALLRGANLPLPESRVFGLERKKSKEQILSELLKLDNEILFVEDRLPTLIRVMDIPSLNNIQLQYAAWGYGTTDDLETARRKARIGVTTLETFLL